jgi:hypothetical protein
VLRGSTPYFCIEIASLRAWRRPRGSSVRPSIDAHWPLFAAMRSDGVAVLGLGRGRLTPPCSITVADSGRPFSMVLSRLWNSLRGRRTVQEVAADFGQQLPTVKLILFRWFAAELTKNGIRGELPGEPDSDSAQAFAAQVVNYLAGDLLDPFDPRASESVRVFRAPGKRGDPRDRR